MKKTLLVLFVLTGFALSSDHGIYLKLLENISNPIENVVELVSQKTQASAYTVLVKKEISTPDLIRKGDEKKCGFRGFVLVLQDKEYTKYLASVGNKYVVSAFLKVGIYETEKGVQVNIADPETINRIVLNDLDESEYTRAVAGVLPFKEKLITSIHQVEVGGKVKKAQEPIRSAEDLREASKDMFMMVGPMTFFDDEDQFPVIYSEKTGDSKQSIQQLISQIEKNLATFKPSSEDMEYQSAPKASDLKWNLSGMIFSPDSNAVVLGLTRSRTEALSFQIAGQPRTDEKNNCPGLDHVCAYPVEVLLYAEKGTVVIRTAREMFRMDMYFWDAGKMAFMEYMNLPKMLDNSIKKALLGTK